MYCEAPCRTRMTAMPRTAVVEVAMGSRAAPRARGCGCVSRDEGATAVEYAILAALVSATIAGTVLVVGTRVLALFASVPVF